uniref:Putative ixostatin n=1 Tax=Ixodes ricinus TaxID=34613 RepID=A0A0K8RC26_IXORI
MILTLSVVLLATFDYIHASQCSTRLENYMKEKCASFTSPKLTYAGFYGCSFTCKGMNAEGQPRSTTYNLVDGLPCGPCQECCQGRCTPVTFSSYNPLSLKSCAVKETAAGRYP